MLLAALFSLGNKAYAQNVRNTPDGVNVNQNDSRNGRMNGKEGFDNGFKPCPCCMKDMKNDNSGNNREGHGVPKNNGQNMGNGGQGFDGQGMNNPPQKRDFPKCKCSKKCKNCDCNKTSSKKSKSSSKKNKNKRNIN